MPLLHGAISLHNASEKWITAVLCTGEEKEIAPGKRITIDQAGPSLRIIRRTNYSKWRHFDLETETHLLTLSPCTHLEITYNYAAGSPCRINIYPHSPDQNPVEVTVEMRCILGITDPWEPMEYCYTYTYIPGA